MARGIADKDVTVTYVTHQHRSRKGSEVECIHSLGMYARPGASHNSPKASFDSGEPPEAPCNDILDHKGRGGEMGVC